MFLFCLELRCVHSYYHLASLVCCYCSMGYLSDSVDYSSSSALPMLVCFLVFDRLMGKHLALLMDVVCRFKSFSEVPCLHGSVVLTRVTVLLGLCNSPCRGCGEPAKPGLRYPLVWIPCFDTVSEKPGSRSRSFLHWENINMIPREYSW
jgi:hypothetical protein